MANNKPFVCPVCGAPVAFFTGVKQEFVITTDENGNPTGVQKETKKNKGFTVGCSREPKRHDIGEVFAYRFTGAKRQALLRKCREMVEANA